MEYYRDSSINTVAYVLFKTNMTKVTKYYSLRVGKGPQKGVTYYLGNEDTAGVRPGHEMSMTSYTNVAIKSNTTLTNYLLAQASGSSKMVYSPASVL